VTLYVARHGETEWNREGRMQGRLGGPLTERGRSQAVELAAAARALGIARLVSSPLPRALETARVVADAIGRAPVIVAELAETDFCRCSGLTEAQIAEQFPGLRVERERDKWRHRWPGGESYADVDLRLRSAVARRDLPGADDTLVIAHQCVNRVLIALLGPAANAEVLAMAQPSHVLLRLGGGRVAHATAVELAWRAGLYAGGTARLN
jgi:broad specificity phosphatase PhoE